MLFIQKKDVKKELIFGRILAYSIEQQEGCLPLLRLIVLETDLPHVIQITPLELWEDATLLFKGEYRFHRLYQARGEGEVFFTPIVIQEEYFAVLAPLKQNYFADFDIGVLKGCAGKTEISFLQDGLPGLIEYDRVNLHLAFHFLFEGRNVTDITSSVIEDTLVWSHHRSPLARVKVDVSLFTEHPTFNAVDIGHALEEQGKEMISTLTGSSLEQYWPREGEWLAQGRCLVTASWLESQKRLPVTTWHINAQGNPERLEWEESSYRPTLMLAVNSLVRYEDHLHVTVHNGLDATPRQESEKVVRIYLEEKEASQVACQWEGEREYTRGEEVEAGGRRYVCTKTNANRFPPQAPLYWRTCIKNDRHEQHSSEDEKTHKNERKAFFTANAYHGVMRYVLAKAWCHMAASHRTVTLTCDVLYEHGKRLSTCAWVQVKMFREKERKIEGKISHLYLWAAGEKRGCRIKITCLAEEMIQSGACTQEAFARFIAQDEMALRQNSEEENSFVTLESVEICHDASFQRAFLENVSADGNPKVPSTYVKALFHTPPSLPTQRRYFLDVSFS